MFGFKTQELTASWKELHNEEFHKLYSSSGTIEVIKSRRMRWAEHVARMGNLKKAHKSSVGKPTV